ncbi:MAG: AAA family ATPase [Verrucomicrobiota bacterium]|jgi:predicted ATPase
MDYHIKEIILDDRFQRYEIAHSAPRTAKSLPNLSKVNIFVGPNNCGKSMFLRLLAATERIQFIPHWGAERWRPFDELENQRDKFIKELQRLSPIPVLREASSIATHCQTLGSLRVVTERIPSLLLGRVQNLLNSAAQPGAARTSHRRGAGSSFTMEMELANLRTLLDSMRDTLSRAEASFQSDYAFNKVYIPTLRGLRDFDGLRDEPKELGDLYAKRTMHDYFPYPIIPPQVFTGLTLYSEIQRLSLGNNDERQVVAQFQQFLSQKLFAGDRVELVPKRDATVLDVKVGGEHQRTVSQLGDGIHAILILLFPLFRNKGQNVLLFCEEPELYLHPHLQRALLTCFSAEEAFKGYQFFLTTHSNHFLDLTQDIGHVSIYTFQKELETVPQDEEATPTFHVENVSNENRRPRDLLGVRNSSVFLSNCTIWVEGITDRRYFKHYLEVYQETLPVTETRFTEDLHYSFVEYGGSCITHWSFLDSEEDTINVDRLCGKLFLIADGDTASRWKGARHEKLGETLRERYRPLKCREVENVLSPNILRAVLRQYGEREFLKFKQEDYEHAPLGAFIKAKVLKGQRKRRRSYADNGTVSDKVGFCEKAISAMKSFDDLSEEAREIAKRLYDFIAANNK